MKVSALTCSTGRPACLELCRGYVKRQTLPVDEHVVQQGGDFWQNMAAGLKRCQGDYIVVFEDDDWYDRNWVEKCIAELQSCDLFGQGTIWNYHVPSGGHEVIKPKRGNCPMHATAFRRELIPQIMPLIAKGGPPKLDVSVWALACKKVKTTTRHVVSMKGMPGTVGYSNAHRKQHYATFDKGWATLESWISPVEVETYKPFRPVA